MGVGRFYVFHGNTRCFLYVRGLAIEPSTLHLLAGRLALSRPI